MTDLHIIARALFISPPPNPLPVFSPFVFFSSAHPIAGGGSEEHVGAHEKTGVNRIYSLGVSACLTPFFCVSPRLSAYNEPRLYRAEMKSERREKTVNGTHAGGGKARIVIGSVNAVFHAREVLAGIGIYSSPVRIEGGKGGCSYGLMLSVADLGRALQQLQRSGIAYERVIRADGR